MAAIPGWLFPVENFRYGFVEFYNANTGYACEIPTSHMENSDNLFIYNGTPLTGILNQQPIESAVDVFPIPCTDDIKNYVRKQKSYVTIGYLLMMLKAS